MPSNSPGAWLIRLPLQVLIQEHHDVQVPAIDAFDTRLQYGQSAASLGAAVPLPGATHAKAPQINKDSAEVQHGYRNTGPTRGHTWSYHNTVPSQSPHEHGFDGLFNTGQKMSYKAPEQGDFGAERSHHGKRTLYLTKLPDNITYGKIFGVIRGGAVVDVWMKSSDHAASVSFVECSAAERFYQYSKKNDIYIDGRRVQPPYPFS